MKQVAGHVGGRNGRQTSKRQTGKVPRVRTAHCCRRAVCGPGSRPAHVWGSGNLSAAERSVAWRAGWVAVPRLGRGLSRRLTS
jgi:hypothetical protein